MFGVVVVFLKKKKIFILVLMNLDLSFFENFVDPDQLALAVPYVMEKHYFHITVKLKKMTKIGFKD